MSRFWKEVGQMLDQKVAQGAAELGQAINSTADGYVPYGTGQQPLAVEGPATSYADMIRRVMLKSLDPQPPTPRG